VCKNVVGAVTLVNEAGRSRELPGRQYGLCSS